MKENNERSVWLPALTAVSLTPSLGPKERPARGATASRLPRALGAEGPRAWATTEPRALGATASFQMLGRSLDGPPPWPSSFLRGRCGTELSKLSHKHDDGRSATERPLLDIAPKKMTL